mgnify:CR=1 FL=1
MKKVMAISLAAIVAFSPMVVKGEEAKDESTAIIPISAPIETPQVQEEYIKFKGKITKIQAIDDSFRILAENDLKEGLNALYAHVSEDVILLNDKTKDFIKKEDLKEGMEITIYYHKDTIMAMSYPPMLEPDVVVVNESKDYGSVEVSKFNKDFLNAEESLYVRPGSDTIIIDKDGNKVEKEDLVDRDWIAFYSIVQESYPAQTSPDKIILMPEREELTQPMKVVLKDEVYKNEEGVLMIPLRQVAEGLGYEVTWNQETKSAELLKGPQWSLVTIGQDKYNFAKMYIELGTAPALKDFKTYVPISFAEEVLKSTVEILADGTVKIIQ